MENIETMIESIWSLVLDEVTDRLQERMVNFNPNDKQITSIDKIIAKEIKELLEQIADSIEIDLDVSVDLVWDTICDKYDLDEDAEFWAKAEAVWDTDFEVPESEPTSGCPGTCQVEKEEKIKEIEGIQSHIVDMEW